MRICPNCGAENNDNALSCVLCEFEFDNDTAEYFENTEPIPAKGVESESVSARNNYSEPPKAARPIYYSDTASSVPERDSAAGKGKIIAIAVAAIILVAGGIGIGILVIKNKGSTPNGSSDSSNSVVSSTTDSTDENTTAASASEETTAEAQETTATAETEATTVNTTSEADTKPAVPKATATVTIEPRKGFVQGGLLSIKINGNYSMYKYEYYYKDAGSPDETLVTSETRDSSQIDIETGSSVSWIRVCVTPYNSNGEPGDTVSVKYTGPWIILDPPANNTSTVTSCTKYGTIYSPSGSKVDGRARSYLIDGGAEAYERHDLTNGWHVTAVNQYYDGSSYWYELYDSDDGDYYGWVSEFNISFY